MSTQHPDNASVPAFVTADAVIKDEDEIVEADYVYSVLRCHEQMWDYEGKSADIDVVLKLLPRNPHFYHEHVLGRDIRLTLRLPNPSVEREMRKKVVEALHSVTSSYDLASKFYNRPQAPIFEVILPLTTSAYELVWLYRFYRDLVAGCQDHPLGAGSTVGDWLGEFHPERIEVIPLVEDRESLLNIDHIVQGYVTYRREMKEEPTHLRVFLARSDPALNYGVVTATLLNKIALQRLHQLERTLGIPIYPIVGVGGAPFRGNFRPGFVDHVMDEYPSAQTFTVQSAFKYDYPQEEVIEAVARVNGARRRDPIPVDLERAREIMSRYTSAYQRYLEELADLVNEIAPFVPPRRSRRLHIGLFGYARSLDDPTAGRRITLPRAITFCASLYSIGIPPEILGLDGLSFEDMQYLEEVCPHLSDLIASAARFANLDNIQRVLGSRAVEFLKSYITEVDQEHKGLTTLIYDRVWRKLDTPRTGRTRTLIEWAAQTRRFLG